MHESKRKILEATLHLVRAKGYSATRIEDVCELAGLTKGSFFHHFKTKEELGVAAAEFWASQTDAFFAQAPYQQHSDPLDRLLAYVDFRKSILGGELPEYTCLAGTMVGETYDSHPLIREACEKGISGHAASLVRDIESAKQEHSPDAEWDPESLGLFTQAVLQGAFILAKAKQKSAVASDCLDHLKRYLECLFTNHQPDKESVDKTNRSG